MYVALDARRADNGHARTWPEEFFRRRPTPKPSDAERAAKEQKRAEKKAQREAIAAAKVKLKDAQKALRSLQRPKKG